MLMTMMLKNIPLILILFVACTRGKYHREYPLPSGLSEAVRSSFRSDENVARDKYQHPLETLEFFGIRENLAVVEVAPGSGLYTEILAPFLAKQGQYFIASPRLPNRPSATQKKHEKKLQDILIRNKDVQTKTRFIPFEPLDFKRGAKANFADLVVTFNSVHNWVASHSADQSFKFFYDILKPKGILGVVQHRISPVKKNRAKSGYMTEQAVIALARKAGFKFIGKSEINANPKDTADYSGGVWTLPPTYRLGEKDRKKYQEIGESDRMTLKFIK